MRSERSYLRLSELAVAAAADVDADEDAKNQLLIDLSFAVRDMVDNRKKMANDFILLRADLAQIRESIKHWLPVQTRTNKGRRQK